MTETVKKITKRERDVLETAESQMRKMGWYLTTGKHVPLKVVRRCVEKGYLRKLDEQVVMSDDDGRIKEPERYRDGYELTEKGNDALGAIKLWRLQNDTNRP